MNTIRKHILTTTVLVSMMMLMLSLLMSTSGMENMSAANGATNDAKAVGDDILFEGHNGRKMVLAGGTTEKTYGVFDEDVRPMAGKIGFRAKVEGPDTLYVTTYTLEKKLMNISGYVAIVPLETVKDKSTHKIIKTCVRPDETVEIKISNDGNYAVGYVAGDYRITGYAVKQGDKLKMYRLCEWSKGYEK